MKTKSYWSKIGGIAVLLFLLVMGFTISRPAWAQLSGKSFFSLKAKSIDGKEVDFSTYAGKVILAVNVASQCGYTHQYAGLEKLYQKYKDQGFVILGFPSNDFGSQEPGSDAEIKKFCKLKYDVQFPIFSKAHVTGAEKSPVYSFLTNEEKAVPKGEVGWNFEKFLINPQGRVIKRFLSPIEPEDVTLVQAIEHEIASAAKH
jgi:glutathione peroxidase